MKMIRADKLADAIAEAQRFIGKAQEAQKSCREVRHVFGGDTFTSEDWDRTAMASAMRSSMDLSKTLSNLRKRD
jgi:hypothetical protein